MRTFTTLEGHSQRLDGGAMFGNAPKALLVTLGGTLNEQQPHNLSCRTLLVQETTALFCGNGIALFEPGSKSAMG